jgi:hypothetical protein
MRLLKFLERLLLGVLFCWMLGCVGFFMLGWYLTTHPDTPAWLLPWSDVTDFAETPDGKVLVSLRFYGRVLCYDRSGTLLTAYVYPYTNTEGRLAVDVDNRVYFRARNIVYCLSSSWDLVSVVQEDPAKDRVWELSRATGEPVLAPQRKLEAAPNRPVTRGDLLFSGARPRDEFHCTDGSILRLAGNSLERVAPTGEILATYSACWLLQLFTFPWPAALAWPLWFVLPGYLAYKQDKAHKNVIIDPTAPVRAQLTEKSLLRRVFTVTTPERNYAVDYDQTWIGERIYVDGAMVARNWWWGHFQFSLGCHHAVITMRLNGGLFFTIDGQVVYHERPPTRHDS